MVALDRAGLRSDWVQVRVAVACTSEKTVRHFPAGSRDRCNQHKDMLSVLERVVTSSSSDG